MYAPEIPQLGREWAPSSCGASLAPRVAAQAAGSSVHFKCQRRLTRKKTVDPLFALLRCVDGEKRRTFVGWNYEK
jgi:hypothetical protein